MFRDANAPTMIDLLFDVPANFSRAGVGFEVELLDFTDGRV